MLSKSNGQLGSSAMELEQEVLDMTKAVAAGICIAKPMYRPLAVLPDRYSQTKYLLETFISKKGFYS